MCDTEGVGQCVLNYNHADGQVMCGMTFFQCAATPVIILTDMNSSVSITNSIESAASNARVMHFLHVRAEEFMFFEHYHREDGCDDFSQVKMRWDGLAERYTGAEFISVTKEALLHLLSCYGYRGKKIPDFRFKPARVIQFRRH